MSLSGLTSAGCGALGRPRATRQGLKSDREHTVLYFKLRRRHDPWDGQALRPEALAPGGEVT